MASFVSENVTAEKVDAMKRFERRRKFWKLILPAIEVLVAVLLLLSLFTPPLSAGEYLRRNISGGLTGGIFIFGVVNVLIVLIFSLSNHQKKLIEPDLYFQYVSSSAAAPIAGFSSAPTPTDGCSSAAAVSKSSASHNEEKTSGGKPQTDSFSATPEDKDTTLTAGEARPVRREMVRAVSSVAETAHAIRRKREMTFPPAATSDHHDVYRRSRSERIDLRGDYGRGMRRLCDMDDLSNDEFRSTVETFIAGKKKMLLKEWMNPELLL